MTILLLAMLAGPALMPPPRLQAMVEGFAGVPALVDDRLLLPDCPAPVLAWAGSGSVEVRCVAPAWRIFVRVGVSATPPPPAIDPPLATAVASPAGRAPPPPIRRGDRIMLEVAGDGFVVAVETTAAADSRDGRVALRTATGRSLSGSIGSDGRVRTTGLSPGNGGR